MNVMRTEMEWGITEGLLAKLKCQVRYMDITEDSRAKLSCSVLLCDVHVRHRAPQFGQGALGDAPLTLYNVPVLIIGPKKTCHEVSLLVPHDVPDPLPDVLVHLHVPHILPCPLREVLVLFWTPDDVPEHPTVVHL
jgi:hypothetical protein